MKSRDGCSLDPTVQDYADADWWMAWVSMADTLSAIKDMKNSPLLPFWSGGLLVTHGAFKQTSLERALGHPTLIILSHNSRLAKLILIACHYEDHRRSETDALYRSRKRGVWIIKGRLLSKAVTKSCPVCARMNKKTASQLMGSLPEVKLKVPCRPFSHISIDLGAPILCKVSRNVRQKCYPIVFCCLNTGALHACAATGYSAAAFFRQFRHFVSLRGYPNYIYTDMGSNLTKAAKMSKKQEELEEFGGMPWDEIRAETAKHDIEWHNCPSQSQWRNGNAEACIKMLKRTMKHKVAPGDLTHEELQTFLAEASNAINERPIDVRRHGGAEPSVCPLTPNSMLLGQRTNTGQLCSNADQGGKDERMEHTTNLFLAWWESWFGSVFDKLVPVQKWREVKRNFQVDDIVLIRFQGKVPPAEFRMAIVKETYPDERGIVRTVLVGCRPRDSREATLPYRSKNLWEFKTSIQRIVLLVPAEERPELLKDEGDINNPVDEVEDATDVSDVATDEAAVDGATGVEVPKDTSDEADVSEVSDVRSYHPNVSPLVADPRIHLCPDVDFTKVNLSTVQLCPLLSSPSLVPVLTRAPH